MNKIVLIGYMGVGKTVLGKKISENLKLAYYDLDDFIEKKVNLSVEDIFKSKGEIYFRRIITKNKCQNPLFYFYFFQYSLFPKP